MSMTTTYWRPVVPTDEIPLPRTLATSLQSSLGLDIAVDREPLRLGSRRDHVWWWLTGYIAAGPHAEHRRAAQRLRDALDDGDVEIWIGP